MELTKKLEYSIGMLAILFGLYYFVISHVSSIEIPEFTNAVIYNLWSAILGGWFLSSIFFIIFIGIAGLKTIGLIKNEGLWGEALDFCYKTAVIFFAISILIFLGILIVITLISIFSILSFTEHFEWLDDFFWMLADIWHPILNLFSLILFIFILFSFVGYGERWSEKIPIAITVLVTILVTIIFTLAMIRIHSINLDLYYTVTILYLLFISICGVYTSTTEELPERVVSFVKSIINKLPRKVVSFVKSIINKLPERVVSFVKSIINKLPREVVSFVKSIINKLPKNSPIPLVKIVVVVVLLPNLVLSCNAVGYRIVTYLGIADPQIALEKEVYVLGEDNFISIRVTALSLSTPRNNSFLIINLKSNNSLDKNLTDYSSLHNGNYLAVYLLHNYSNESGLYTITVASGRLKLNATKAFMVIEKPS